MPVLEETNGLLDPRSRPRQNSGFSLLACWVIFLAGAALISLTIGGPNSVAAQSADLAELTQVISSFDYAVVGAGSAGCVVAGRLAEAGKSVVLLERGPDDDWRGSDGAGSIDPWVPGDWQRMISQPSVSPDLGQDNEASARNEMVGGCGMHNHMVWMRGDRGVFDRWGDEEWSARCAYARYIAMENAAALPDVDPRDHGYEGPVRLSPSVSPRNTEFDQWALARGLRWTGDFNGRNQEGVGPMHVNLHGGKRYSLNRAFLPPSVRMLRNFKLMTHSVATRVIFEGLRAVGVEYRVRSPSGDSASGIVYAREVILCAGAYRTPQLLMLSGVGRERTLRRLGIPIVAISEGVGENLQDHPLALLPSRPLRTPNTSSASPGANGGILTRSTFCRASTNVKECAFPDLQFFTGDAGEIYGCLTTPLSRGYVTLRSRDPEEFPVVRNNFLNNPVDLVRMKELWSLAANFSGSDSTAPPIVMGHDLAGFFRTAGADQVQALFNRSKLFVFSGYHASSTCKMGEGPLAVVDYELRVKGVRGLRVADASVFPFIPNSNTNAPSALVGYTAADLILGARCA